MGKTASGAVWLSEKYLLYLLGKFWRNTTDDDVIKFLNFLQK